MKDTCKILRKAIYDAINGNITYDSVNVPVYDELQPSGNEVNVYILLSTQQETDDSDDLAFRTRSTIDIEIVTKTGSSVSKDINDDVYESMMEILIDTPNAFASGVTIPSGFQFLNVRRESSFTLTLAISPTESILRKIVKIGVTITQK